MQVVNEGLKLSRKLTAHAKVNIKMKNDSTISYMTYMNKMKIDNFTQLRTRKAVKMVIIFAKDVCKKK